MTTSIQINNTKDVYERSDFVHKFYTYKEFVGFYHEHVYKENIQKLNSNIKVVYVNF